MKELTQKMVQRFKRGRRIIERAEKDGFVTLKIRQKCFSDAESSYLTCRKQAGAVSECWKQGVEPRPKKHGRCGEVTWYTFSWCG
jgi:hypothetical protein